MLNKSKEKMDMQDLKDLGTVDIFEGLEDVADPRIKRALGSLGQRMKKRNGQEAGKTAEQPAPPPETAEVVQLPFWPDPARGVPNASLRGALFAAIQGKNRRYIEREKLDAPQGLEILFTGAQLNQSDLDVWEQCLHIARNHLLGNRCEFTEYGFLKAIGRATGKSQKEQLRRNFARLLACGVEITYNRITYGGSLIEYYRDEDTGHYVLAINPKLISLFNANWTAIDWEQRKALGNKPLAKWMHGWLASHADPYPVKVESLMKWSGSRAKQTKHFKERLKEALTDLQSVGAINSWHIDEADLVHINRTPSSSQKKYLTRAKPRKK